MFLRRQRPPIPSSQHPIGKEPEILRTAQGRFSHVANRLPGVHTLNQRNFVFSFDNCIGDLIEQLFSLFS